MLLLPHEQELKRLEKELVADDNAKWVAKHEATTPKASVCMHRPIVL
jgi:hypothetical protein